jgi:hypothetical protein
MKMGITICLYYLLLFVTLIPNFTASQVLFQVWMLCYDTCMHDICMHNIYLLSPYFFFFAQRSIWIFFLGFWWLSGIQLGVMEEGRRMVQLLNNQGSWTGQCWDYSCLAPSPFSVSFWWYASTKLISIRVHNLHWFVLGFFLAPLFEFGCLICLWCLFILAELC